MSEKGMGKRTYMSEFTCQNRGGKGVKCYKITEKTGFVVAAKVVHEDQEVMLITNEGIIIRIEVSGISVRGRVTSGVKLMNLDSSKDIVVASIAKVRKEENDSSEKEDDLSQKMEKEPEDTDENSSNE